MELGRTGEPCVVSGHGGLGETWTRRLGYHHLPSKLVRFQELLDSFRADAKESGWTMEWMEAT